MKKFIFSTLIGLFILFGVSGCGTKQNINIQSYKPNTAQDIQYKENVLLTVEHSSTSINFQESIFDGLSKYLIVHAPYIKLQNKTDIQNKSDIYLILDNVRESMWVTGNVKSKIILKDLNNNVITNNDLFISQDCTNGNTPCKKNERYNIGLLNGKLLLEGISKNNNKYIKITESVQEKILKNRKITENIIQEKQKIVNMYIKENNFQALKEYTDKYPNVVYYIKDSSIRLTLTGEKGMKVGDIKKLLKDGKSELIIVSLIKRVKTPYKEFTLQEIETLQSMGLPDKIIATMIDITTELLKDAKRQKEQQFYLAEQKRINNQKTTVIYQNNQSQKTDEQGNPVIEKVTDELINQGVSILLDQLF
mgnify:CR=1 FL=1